MSDGTPEETITPDEKIAPDEKNTPDPGIDRVRGFLLYNLSLPERALRATLGVAAGTVKHSAGLLVPQAFRSSQTYRTLVEQTLNFLIADVAGVERAAGDEPAAPQVDQYVARKAVGNFVEMAGLATLHLSPMLVLAVVSDVAYGSRTYLRELSAELKRKGVIDENSTIDGAGDLLEAVSKAAATTSSAFDTPPLSIDGLRETIEKTQAAVADVDPTKVIPQAEIDRLWTEIREMAVEQHVGVWEISSAMGLRTVSAIGHLTQGALSSVRAAGSLVDRHLLDHYRESLGEIHAKGYYATLAETSGPYIEAVWRNFSSEKPTLTEDLLSGKLIGQAYSTVRRWLCG